MERILGHVIGEMAPEARAAFVAGFWSHMRERRWPTLKKVNPLHERINERAAIRRRISAVTHDGKIAVVRSGMDCDCTQYRRVSHIPAPVSVMVWLRDEAAHEEWLDGPESTWFASPLDEPEDYRSADRALEAYEEGHPGVVYWGDL